MARMAFGRQVCGSLDEAANREWLVADGLGGYAMGTVAGLRTRRYHGLLIRATHPPIGRHLGLAALDPVLVIGDRRIRLGVHEWGSGAMDPQGFVHLESFELADGVPRWRWSLGDVVLERELAMTHGHPAVGIVHRLVRAPGPVRLELEALCTWRDVHGERFGVGDPDVEVFRDGFVFESAYRVRGPAFQPDGAWYRDVRYRVEAEHGLPDREDLFLCGTFAAHALRPGDEVCVEAWAGDLRAEPQSASEIVRGARDRALELVAHGKPRDATDEALILAADQFVVDGPAVVAGYPWFGEWSRDTMTSYEGLFLETNRWDEGRALLVRAASSLSEGMLANTSDIGGSPEYNTADATLWFLNAIGRHVEVMGDLDLAAELAPALDQVVDRHLAGARFGIAVDRADGLLAQGTEGWALTWMDARVHGHPVTPRDGKAVEINALWINGLATCASLQERLGMDSARCRAVEAEARKSFASRFLRRGLVLDAVDSPTGDSTELRPNQLLAVSLPYAPLKHPGVVRACGPLVTSLGLRTLAPAEESYVGRHRGTQAERDAAYHQGTVWPWLIGPYVEAALKTGVDVAGVLGSLESHLSEWGLGSVSETADGDPPHAATGCPFQTWSVAEVFRARRLLQR